MDDSQRSRLLIFGATGGIGSALARRMADRGAELVLASRGRARGEALAEELGARWIEADVTRPGEVERAVEVAVERLGALDGIALCVGSILLKPAHLVRDEEWEQTLALNLHPAFRVVRAAGHHLAEHGGSVVLFSTTAAQVGLANHEAIAAAKAGIEGLVRSAASSYASRGLRFNAVAPGLVKTPLSERLRKSDASRKVSEALHPLGRLGEPDEVAEVAAWLLGPSSGWVTGQVVAVDGGISTVRPKR
jgi:NAD(P)-dependent dehydrogenase (short-subunit alcohol dehydrogenase family)